MSRRRRVSPEQIITNLRPVEVELAKCSSIEQSCKTNAVSPQCYYRGRKEYGGLEVDKAKRLK